MTTSPSCARTFRTTARVCLLVVAALLAHQWARAEAKADENAARVLYEAGASAYGAGQFEAAVQALSQAYSLTPRASVLFSLAQAERRLFVLNGDVAVANSAVAHFKTYLEQVPHGGRRADAVEALGELAVLITRPNVLDARGMRRGAATRLLVSVEPASAEVRVDGVVETERPLIIETTPGMHTITVDAPGYFGDERQVSAVADGVVATEFRLAAKPAKVRISAHAGTQVWLDGARLGTTPLGTLQVAAGRHRFDFSSPGYVGETRVVDVARGAELTVAAVLQLTTRRKISHGLLIGGGVAGLVGGAAAVTALVFESDASSVDAAARDGNITRAQLLDYNGSLERRDAWRSVAVASFVAGAGLLLGGGALYLWNPEGASFEGSGGVRVVGRWNFGRKGERAGL